MTDQSQNELGFSKEYKYSLLEIIQRKLRSSTVVQIINQIEDQQEKGQVLKLANLYQVRVLKLNFR